jgi:hypothetical protein
MKLGSVVANKAQSGRATAKPRRYTSQKMFIYNPICFGLKSILTDHRNTVGRLQTIACL